jgi:hypothetical protein
MASLTEVKNGGYSALGISGAISDGVVALPGFEIVQATFAKPLPIEQAFQTIENYLEHHNRPVQALCALHLRSPSTFSPAEFGTFNQGYLNLLEHYQLLVDGKSPLARTNVVPVSPPSTPSVYTFSYTLPSQEKRKTFVAAGVGDIRDDGSIIRSGETSEEAWQEKIQFIADALRKVVEQLGVNWQDTTHLNFYGLQALPSSTLNLLEGATRHGITWYPSVPPLAGLDAEIDVRGVYQEFFDVF